MESANEKVVDRTGWGSGPWDNEPDKLNWTTASGLPGMIVRNDNGALCGYAAVPDNHPWHGVQYHGRSAEYPYTDESAKEEVDYTTTPEGKIDVHGGLTYSDSCQGRVCHIPEPGEPDNVWWFGFDCSHSGDYAPKEGTWDHNITHRRLMDYKTVAYVRAEVERLAEQLAGVNSLE